MRLSTERPDAFRLIPKVLLKVRLAKSERLSYSGQRMRTLRAYRELAQGERIKVRLNYRGGVDLDN